MCIKVSRWNDSNIYNNLQLDIHLNFGYGFSKLLGQKMAKALMIEGVEVCLFVMCVLHYGV